jgi:hypothetical protein
MVGVWCDRVGAMGLEVGLRAGLALWGVAMGLALSNGRCRMADVKFWVYCDGLGWADGFLLEC